MKRIAPTLPQPGDILLVRANHFVSKLIKFGQRGYGKEAAQWNHCAVYIGNGEIVEALTRGVVRGFASKYPPSEVRVIPVRAYTFVEQDKDMRQNARNFAVSCIGEKYGFLTIFAIAIKTLTKGKLDFSIADTTICSGLAARSLERLGWNFQPYDPSELTPAFLAREIS